MSNTSIYNTALLPAPRRNLIDMSQEHFTSLDAGWLVPFNIVEMLPGDTFTGQVAHKIRTLPLNSPAFQQFDVGWFTAVVPMRLLMNNKGWQKFIAEDPTAPPPAYVDYSCLANLGQHSTNGVYGVESQSLANYLGLPAVTSNSSVSEDGTPISLAPFLAYQMVYDEWFRDNNLSDPIMDGLMLYYGDGGEFSEAFISQDAGALNAFKSLTTLRHRAFRKDMFTSALPDTQRGQQVIIPVSASSESVDYSHIKLNNIDPKFRFYSDGTNTVGFGFDSYALGTSKESMVAPADEAWSTTRNAIPVWGTGSPSPYRSDPAHQGVQIQLGDGTGPYISLEGLSGIEVNAFRTAMMTQSFLERLEVCGSRYTEVIRGMFGVYTPDARLQRPEMIAGWRSSIMIGDVLQHESAYDQEQQNDLPAGSLHGTGLGIASGKHFKYRAYEHCYLIQIVSILPRQAYWQGIPKMFTRQDRYDYFWPLLAHQGEEAVLNREIKHTPGDSDENNGVFGYQSRYYDYRSNYDRISGELTPGKSLGYWQGSRNFVNTPTLSMQFVECRFQESGLSRIFPVEYYPNKNQGFFIADIFTKLKAWRPVPKFATPASL